jgi:CO/xanthine dehydrogenase Mo-binding subunit
LAGQQPNQTKRLLTRRRFLLGTVALVGGGLGLRWLMSDEPSLATGPDVLEPNAFLQITPAGDYIFQLDKVEMGQGTMTSLATLLAEELDLDPARLEVRFAPVLSFFRRPIQITGQSRSISDSWEVLRETGATARAMLLAAAAKRLKVDVSLLQTDDGMIIDTTTDSMFPYHEFAEAAAQLAPPWRVALKPKAEWRWLGTNLPRLDSLPKVTGAATYGIDVQLDGMLTAVVARCPELGATVTAFDAEAALVRPGVRGIVEIPGGVAVVADDFWTAQQASEIITLEWSPGPLRAKSDQSIRVNRDQVMVHTTYLGGGFGRRVLSDFVAEAALIAKAFAVPVKLVWTREHDMQHAFYRQQTLHRLTGRVARNGTIRWWDHSQVAAGTGDLLTPVTIATVLSEQLSILRRQAIGDWLGDQVVKFFGAFQAQEGAKELLYDIPDRRLAQTTFNPGMPISIWRSVGNSYNGFVIESFMDELAAGAGQDSIEFRRRYLQHSPAALAVLERVAQESGWGQATPERFQGVALFKSFGTIVGQVAEVSVSATNVICVHRVCCVVDCGQVATPDIVRSQMESGIIFGLTAALYGEINMQAGRIVQSNFHDYPMVRMHDVPRIDVHIMDVNRDPAGIGEPGTPPIAAAVANAVYAATGQRLRDLPLRLS